MVERALILILFLLGFYGLIARRNLIKKVYALAIQSAAIVLLFVLEGSRVGSIAPLLDLRVKGSTFVDPLPQALMLTAIVVGVCVSALALSLAYRLYLLYGTLDIEELGNKVDHE
ncbi:NADH-quinone oxidoreductase subunit K [Treponema sp.]